MYQICMALIQTSIFKKIVKVVVSPLQFCSLMLRIRNCNRILMQAKNKKNIANSFCTVYLLETVCNEQRRRNIQFRWTRSLHAIYSCVVFGCITFPSNLSCICVLTASILKYLFWRSSKVARAIEIEGEKSRYFWFLYFIGKDWGYILIS